MPSGDMDLLYWRPILWGSGVVVTRSQPVGAVSFPATNDASAFTFKGWAALDGKQLALLSADLFHASPVLTNATNFVRYWVDLARDSAIVRAVAESGVLGQQMTGYEIDIEYGPHARTWLPSRWVVRETLNGKVTMMQTVEATQTELLTTDDPALYVLEPEPGSKVYAIETRRDPKTREILVSRKHYTTTAAGQNNGKGVNP